MKKILVCLLVLISLVNGASALISDYNDNMVLLAHMNVSPSNTTAFYDSSASAHVIVSHGATYNQSSKQFGNASADFYGNRRLAIPASTDFYLGSRNYTVMLWVKRGSTGAMQDVYSQATASGYPSGIIIRYEVSNALTVVWATAATTWETHTTSTTFTNTTGFHQIAVQLNGTHVNVYSDGILQPMTASSAITSTPYNTLTGSTLGIGSPGEYAGLYFTGGIDEVAAWKDVAVPIADLYPQTTEIGASSETCTPAYTVDGTAYCYGQQFTATSGAGTGVLDDYQIRVNLSTTVSPSTATTLYTNGSTRSDWNDIQFTDSSDNPLPFWIENNTYSASSATAWVRTPVSPAGTTVRMYYGNSTKATSEIDGLNTFPLWDDFNEASVNTTTWADGGGNTISAGILTSTGTGAGTYEGILSKSAFPVNTSVVGRALLKQAGDGGSFGWRKSLADVVEPASWIYYYSSGSAWQSYNYVSSASRVAVTSDANYHRYENSRISTTSNRVVIDITSYSNTGQVYSSDLNATFNVYAAQSPTLDWAFIRYARATEPTLSGFTSIPSGGGTAPTAAFSGTPLSGHAPLSVAFTDESTDTPTSWNWTFGDGGINITNQNPVHVYTTAGTYDVNLSVGNAFGNSSLVKPGYVIVSNSSEVYPAISSNATSGVFPFAVAFTDNTATYNATIDSWYWQFGDGNTSALQNPEYTYLGSGTFLANLTVTNTSFGATNTSASITITSSMASGVNHADMLMSPQYTLTIHVTDSDTGLPIPVVTIMDSDGQTVTTTTGTGVLTEGYGLVAGTLVSDGYYSRAFSVVVDEDMERTYQMTPVSETTTTTWWTPHTVQVNVIDISYSNPLPNVRINATYNESSMPSQWIEDLYGIRGTTAEDMINSTLILGGTTGTGGSVTFTMLGAIKYDFYLNSVEHGIVNYHVAEYPSDSILNIYVSSSQFILPINRNSTYADINTTRIYVVEPDLYNVSMCIDYQDTSGRTSLVTDRWIFKNNNTAMNTTTFIPGITLNTHCYTIPNVRGTEVWWGWNATRLGV